MTKSEYQKPFMVVERFVAQEYCEQCAVTGHLKTGILYTGSGYKILYHDTHNIGYYDSDEKVNTPSLSGDVTFYPNENVEKGYAKINENGILSLVNQVPLSSYKYYRRKSNGKYLDAETHLYMIYAKDGNTYYYSNNNFTFSKNHS